MSRQLVMKKSPSYGGLFKVRMAVRLALAPPLARRAREPEIIFLFYLREAL
jgi:hypothetical protein